MDGNKEQIEFWNETLGEVWVRRREPLNAASRPFGQTAMDALGIEPGQSVLDVGCGLGDTTRELLSRVSPGGTATGVDVSRPMLEVARREAKDVDGLTFIEADAQVADLGEGRFDRVFSRFGVMFFSDPVAAFANLARVTKPGGRLGFVCWQDALLNPWMANAVIAAIPICGMPEMPEPTEPGPFSLADPDRTRGILSSAGWQDIDINPLERDAVLPVGLDEGIELMVEIGPLRRMLEEATDEQVAQVKVALRETLKSHERPDGFGAGAAVWIVTAQR